MTVLTHEHDEQDDMDSPSIETKHRKDYIIGVLLLLCVVFLWTASNFLTEKLFQEGFEKPFLVTYLNTSSFSLYLIPFVYRFLKDGEIDANVSRGQYTSLAASDNPESQPLTERNEEESLSPLTVRETATLAASFCVLWFAANWTVTASLDYTSVASCTILASTSGFFTFALGRIFDVEAFSMAKLAAVAVSFSGVLLVSLSDYTPRPALTNKYPNYSPSSNQTTPALLFARSADATSSSDPSTWSDSNPLLGDFLALLSALFYGLYVILLKVRIQVESRIDMKLFFGFVGLFNIIALWPAGLLLHVLGAEILEAPHGAMEWSAVLLNMFITFASDFIYVIAMLKTTPLLVTIGISLTIPLAIFGDFLLGVSTRPQAMLGGAMVLAGFLIVGFGESRDHMNNTSNNSIED
jgi:solute carrier family 35 protein F5